MQTAMTKMETTEEEMSKISKAGGGLYKFVTAVLAYCHVAREIKPKRDRVSCRGHGFVGGYQKTSQMALLYAVIITLTMLTCSLLVHVHCSVQYTLKVKAVVLLSTYACACTGRLPSWRGTTS